ncbi:MAG: hypothetical protein RIB59_16220 [Rhodospirillales bacterium]
MEDVLSVPIVRLVPVAKEAELETTEADTLPVCETAYAYPVNANDTAAATANPNANGPACRVGARPSARPARRPSAPDLRYGLSIALFLIDFLGAVKGFQQPSMALSLDFIKQTNRQVARHLPIRITLPTSTNFLVFNGRFPA